MSMEVIKEIELMAVNAVRFAAELYFESADHEEFMAVPEHVTLTALRGLETEESVGMVKLTARESEYTISVDANGLLDYGSPERLLLELGELGISVRLGGHEMVDIDCQLVRVAPGSPNVLKQVPMNWNL